MNKVRSCQNKSCESKTDENNDNCPNCKGSKMNSKGVRFIGFIMLVFGALITLPMIFVILEFMPVMLDPQTAVMKGRFGGSAEMVMPSMALLVSVFIFGLSNLVFGGQRAFFAVRNKLTKPIILLSAFVFMGLLFYVGSKIPDGPVHSSNSDSMGTNATRIKDK